MSRIESLDNAKGIGIILVVIGHCVDVFSAVSLSISSFHMPLFFMLSGYLFNDNILSLKDLIWKRTKQLMVPFIVFSIMIGCLQSVLLTTYSLLELKEKAPGALWFVGILYLAEIIYAVFCSFINNRVPSLAFHGGKILFSIICMFAGLLLHNSNFVLPYSLTSIFVAISYYTAGNSFRQFSFINTKTQMKVGCYKRIIIAIFMLLIPITYALITKDRIGLIGNGYSLSNYLLSYLGVAGVILLSSSFSCKAIEWLGKNTLVIMATHMTILQLSMSYFVPLFDSKLAGKILEQIILWILLFLCIKLFNYSSLRWIQGKKKE